MLFESLSFVSLLSVGCPFGLPRAWHTAERGERSALGEWIGDTPLVVHERGCAYMCGVPQSYGLWALHGVWLASSTSHPRVELQYWIAYVLAQVAPRRRRFHFLMCSCSAGTAGCLMQSPGSNLRIWMVDRVDDYGLRVSLFIH